MCPNFCNQILRKSETKFAKNLVNICEKYEYFWLRNHWPKPHLPLVIKGNHLETPLPLLDYVICEQPLRAFPNATFFGRLSQMTRIP